MCCFRVWSAYTSKDKHGFDRNMVLLLDDTAPGILVHYSMTVMRQILMSQIRNSVN